MNDHDQTRRHDTALQDAISLATRRVPLIRPGTTIRELVQNLRHGRFDTVTEIAVCEGHTLVGLVPIERVFAAGDDDHVEDHMDRNPPQVTAGIDQEIAVWRAVERNKRAVPVVDDGKRFLGLIPAEQMLRVLLTEHEEDMARLGGSTHDRSMAQSAAEEAIPRRLRHRLPWLLVGLLGALFTAGIISAFEGMLTEHVMLLFFIPSVVYLADAVGTQTETIVIRGLSVGVSIRRIIRRELLTGLIAGIAIALAFFPVALIVWQDMNVAVVVSLSVIAASSVATVVAVALPYVLQRFGTDPAFGSGPLATVIQDLLSVILFLLIAILVLNV
jgi:magnesium transporter